MACHAFSVGDRVVALPGCNVDAGSVDYFPDWAEGTILVCKPDEIELFVHWDTGSGGRKWYVSAEMVKFADRDEEE